MNKRLALLVGSLCILTSLVAYAAPKNSVWVNTRNVDGDNNRFSQYFDVTLKCDKILWSVDKPDQRQAHFTIKDYRNFGKKDHDLITGISHGSVATLHEKKSIYVSDLQGATDGFNLTASCAP